MTLYCGPRVQFPYLPLSGFGRQADIGLAAALLKSVSRKGGGFDSLAFRSLTKELTVFSYTYRKVIKVTKTVGDKTTTEEKQETVESTGDEAKKKADDMGKEADATFKKMDAFFAKMDEAFKLL